MTLLKILHALLVLLPEIIEFIKEAQKRADEKALQEKVKEDFKKINEAFKNKDAEALNEIFKQ